MTIQEAILKARKEQSSNGKYNAIRRTCWGERYPELRWAFLFVSPYDVHQVLNEDCSTWCPHINDLLANDWEVPENVPLARKRLSNVVEH